MNATHSLKDYQKSGDAAGVMVLTLLACRKPIKAAEKRAGALNAKWPTLNKHQQLFVRLVQRWAGQDSLDKLEAKFAYRVPVIFSKTAALFFHNIFPPVSQPNPRPRHNRGTNIPSDVLLIPRSASVLLRARELLELPRLITEDPKNWTAENRIFNKEDLYAVQMAKRMDFNADIAALQEQHGSELKNSHFPLFGNPDAQSSLGSLEHSLAVLCLKYCLLGLTSDFQPIPKPFYFQACDDAVHVVVPNYMEFNWRDDLPVDVFKFLQRRKDVVYGTTPQRMSDQDRSTNEYAYDAAMLEDHATLTGEGITGNELWDELLRRYPHVTHADGPDDRRKVIRRRVLRLLSRLKQ